MARSPSMMRGTDNTPEPPAEPKRVLWADYMDIMATLSEPPPVLKFIIPGLLEGTMGVLVSPGGAGKSMLSTQIALSVAAGQDFWGVLGEHPPINRVLMVNAEDPAVILARRLHSLKDSNPRALDASSIANLRIKAVHGKNWSVGTWDGSAFTPSDGLAILRAELKEYVPGLLIFDTLNRVLAGISENDNAALGRIISEVEEVCAETKTASLILHHTSKATALGGMGDAQQAARGASAITDNARWQTNLITMDVKEAEERGVSAEDRRSWVRMCVTKVNYAAAPPDRWLHRGASGVLTIAEPGERCVRKPNTKGDKLDAKIGW